MPRLRILISGAGVAGIALAFWLSKLGHDVTVIERFPGLRTTGLQLDLRGYGIEVMKRMGLETAFIAHSAPELGIQIVDTNGRRWGYFPANKSGKGSQGFTSEFEIMRGDLCSIMYDAAGDNVSYIFGLSIESYRECAGDSIEVRFNNGVEEKFDLLVGADGQGSNTRKMMFGSESGNGFQPLDDHVAYLRIPRPIQEGEEYIATGYIAPGARFALTRRNTPDQLQVYLTGNNLPIRLKTVQRGDIAEQKKAFVEEFQGAGWEVDSILDSLMESDDFYCESQGVVKLESWSRGRVTLLGDAAYCSASSGQGTSAAIVGAYVLAGEIARHVGIPDSQGTRKDVAVTMALEAYEREFRPYVDQIQKGIGEKNIFDKIQWSTWQVRILYYLVWLAWILRLDKLAGFVRDPEVRGWKLPDYNELKI